MKMFSESRRRIFSHHKAGGRSLISDVMWEYVPGGPAAEIRMTKLHLEWSPIPVRSFDNSRNGHGPGKEDKVW